MLSSALLAVTSLVAVVSAQTPDPTVYTPPPGFNPGLLLGAKANSILAQRSAEALPKQTDAMRFKNTLPYFICQANFGQCIQQHPNDLDGQKVCKDGQKACGTREATDSSSSQTTLSTATAGPTSSRTGSATTTASNAAKTTNAAAALHVAQDYSLGVLATLFLGAFGFLL
ncbi:hypothetical protein PRK78_005566 [Emydomyces testavorans]|uniref:DUF7707 domain-containing protein n=1 Tax=Emydomyces testavorans TaxID=2070801 RepID=A0AAF0DLY9_9EURO|nr:hypothetical protein PRK78_005566 [Emydomyces testavorans]